MKKVLLTSFFAVIAVVANADTFDVSLWRGETLHVHVPEMIKLGPVPAPLSIREGGVKEVRFRPSRLNFMYKSVADKVDWTGWNEGPRIIEVTAPADMKPGKYECGDLKIRVVDRVLPPPSQWKYVLDLWQHPWAISRVHNVKPFSRKYWKVARPVYELLATAGQKFITATLLDRPWNNQCYDAYETMIRHIKCADGSWRFDYKVFDEYVEFAKSCGIGPYIACYTLCPWGNMVYWQDEKGNTYSTPAPAGSDAFKEYWGDFLVDFSKHLKEKGWFDITYIAMDERSPEEVKVIADFMQEKAPGLKLSMAGNRKPSDFKGIKIDCYSQFICDIDEEFLAEIPALRAKGYMTTFYVCSGPNEPNNFLDSDNDESFWTGFYPAAVGLDGFLRWAWNSWGVRPWGERPNNDVTVDVMHPRNQGNSFLCYPDGSASWRFLMIRQGIVAAEKARILREKGLFIKQLDKLKSVYDYKNKNKPTYKSATDRVRILVNKEN